MTRKFCFTLVFTCFAFVANMKAQTGTAFAMRQTGYYMGGAKYKVKSTGDKGSYPVGYMSFEGIYFTEDMYYMGNANYLFLNGGNAWKEGEDGVEGVDISLIEAVAGTVHGHMATGIAIDYGWHGPWLKSNAGVYQDKGNYLGIGGQLVHIQPFGKVFRSLTTLTSCGLLTNSGVKVFDGFNIRFDSQIQFVPFSWLAFGVRPGFEYRSYRLDNSEKKDLRTYTSTVQFCIGLNLWRNAQSY